MTRPLVRPLARAAALAILAILGGCGPDYSPNTYSTTAVQQANKVDKGVIIGVRPVDVSSSGVTGAAVGGAAGGALGANTPGGGVTSTLGAIGGGLVGGLIGTTVEHAAADTTAFEYIVRKLGADPKAGIEMVSVTQKDDKPLAVGLHVLVIAGPQARIVPDYTVEPEPPVAAATPPAAAPASPPPPATAPSPPAVGASPLPAPLSLLPSAAASGTVTSPLANTARAPADAAALGAAVAAPGATAPGIAPAAGGGALPTP